MDNFGARITSLDIGLPVPTAQYLYPEPGKHNMEAGTASWKFSVGGISVRRSPPNDTASGLERENKFPGQLTVGERRQTRDWLG